MVENIDKVLDRGGRIELLVDRTTGLSDNTFRFKKQAKGLQQALWWKNAKLVYCSYPPPLTTPTTYVIRIPLVLYLCVVLIQLFAPCCQHTLKCLL